MKTLIASVMFFGIIGFMMATYAQTIHPRPNPPPSNLPHSDGLPHNHTQIDNTRPEVNVVRPKSEERREREGERVGTWIVFEVDR